jgi:glycosyltransferase involved in cell wall biosynthesis
MTVVQLMWPRTDAYGGIPSVVRYLSRALEELGVRVVLASLADVGAGDLGNRFESLLEIERPDVVHSHNLHFERTPGLVAKVCSFIARHRLLHLLTVHDMRAPDTDELTVLRGAKLVAVSSYVRRCVTHFTGLDCTVIPPAIDFRAFPIATGCEGFTVAYPSRLIPSKGAVEAIRLLGQIQGQEISILLSEADRPAYGATDEYVRELRAVAASYSRLRVEHVRGDNSVPGIYHRAALTLALPQSPEGFGLVPLESLACGRPVVAMPLGGMLEWMPGLPGVAVFRPDETERARDAVLRIVESWPIWRDFAIVARDILERKYDSRVVARRYLTLYQSQRSAEVSDGCEGGQCETAV